MVEYTARTSPSPAQLPWDDRCGERAAFAAMLRVLASYRLWRTDV